MQSGLGVELFHEGVDDLISLLGLSNALAGQPEALVFVRFIDLARLVLLVSVELDLLTLVLNLGEA